MKKLIITSTALCALTLGVTSFADGSCTGNSVLTINYHSPGSPNGPSVVSSILHQTVGTQGGCISVTKSTDKDTQFVVRNQLQVTAQIGPTNYGVNAGLQVSTNEINVGTGGGAPGTKDMGICIKSDNTKWVPADMGIQDAIGSGDTVNVYFKYSKLDPSGRPVCN